MVTGSRQRLRALDFSFAPSIIVSYASIDNSPLSQVASTNSLGAHVDKCKHLSWDTHITKISKKVASGIGALTRCRSFVPLETLIYAFTSIITL